MMEQNQDKPTRIIGPGFQSKVYELVSQVHVGFVTTYGDVAEAMGARRIARHIGFALAALQVNNTAVPWHRVINSKGRISFRGDEWRGEEQRLRLQAEGIEFDVQGRIIDFEKKRHPFAPGDELEPRKDV